MKDQKTLTLGSLFSGSGGFELAGLIAGIKPVWLSEIDPFAVLVTHKRLPGVKYYGDVCKLKGAELEPVDVITFGSPCFPEGTLVLTEEGYLPIEKVEVGKKVLTHKGRWRSVLAVGAKHGETVILKGNHYGLECTPNHPIYSSGERKYYPQLGNGKRGSYLLLTEEKVWIAAEQMKGRLWAVPKAVENLPIALLNPVSRKQKAMPQISEDLFYFVGRWLGDGWVCNGQRTGRPEGQTYGRIYLCDSEDKESELREIVEKMSANYSVSHDCGVVRFSFASQVFSKWLIDNFGKYAYGKTMPGWVFGMQESYRASLMRGILDSDGYRIKENAWKICTVSKRLAESIRLLAEIQGYSTTVSNVKAAGPKVIEGRIVHQRDWYSIAITLSEDRIHFSDELHGWYRVRQVQATNETKVVYNLTVDEDNSYVADGIVVHNCQDLSIAGRRAGIQEGERSSLFFQAIRIIREMREATNGKYPRYCVWENVPGVFSSSNGEDFRTVLEEIVRVKSGEISIPKPEGKWTRAGEIVGEDFSVAWRVLDAQYWGVPQRRARVYLVGDFGGESAGQILFESEGMCGNIEEGIGSRQGTAGSVEESTGETGKGLKAAGFSTEHSAKTRSIGYEEEVSPTLRAGVVPAAMLFDNHAQDSRYDGPLEESPTVTARYGTGGNNQPLVAMPKPYTLKIRSGCSGGGKGALWQRDKSATLATNNDQTLFQPEIKAYGICSKQSNAMLSDNPHSGFYEAKTSRTLDRGGGNPSCNQGGICILSPETYDVRITSDGTKNARAHCYKADKSRCLDTSEPNPDSNHGSICILVRKGLCLNA